MKCVNAHIDTVQWFNTSKFRSSIFFFQGSLIANMILGIIILKRRYKLSKYLSVFMISVGIAICTIVSAKDVVSIEY